MSKSTSPGEQVIAELSYKLLWGGKVQEAVRPIVFKQRVRKEYRRQRKGSSGGLAQRRTEKALRLVRTLRQEKESGKFNHQKRTLGMEKGGTNSESPGRAPTPNSRECSSTLG